MLPGAQNSLFLPGWKVKRNITWWLTIRASDAHFGVSLPSLEI